MKVPARFGILVALAVATAALAFFPSAEQVGRVANRVASWARGKPKRPPFVQPRVKRRARLEDDGQVTVKVGPDSQQR